MSILGNRVLRVEDPRLLTEGGRYVADLRDDLLAAAVHATFVRSTVAHATIWHAIAGTLLFLAWNAGTLFPLASKKVAPPR